MGVTPSSRGRSAALRAEPATQSQAEPAATNAGANLVEQVAREICGMTACLANSSSVRPCIRTCNGNIENVLAQYEDAARAAISVALEAAANIADQWRDENKAAVARARKSHSEGAQNMAEMLDGAAIECNAIAQEIRKLASVDGRPKDGDEGNTSAPLATSAVLPTAGDAQPSESQPQ